ncbi:MAG: formyltetrahydrofolate deformylase [Burkholderiaceae bacterium]
MDTPRTEPRRWCATLACDSAQGQVAALLALLDRHGAYVEELTVFDDTSCRRFYVRCVVRFVPPAPFEADRLRAEFGALLARHGHADGALHDMARPTRVLLMVSKADHCLRDLLARWRRRELPMQIAAVASNHRDLEPLAAAECLPFHHLPISADTKAEQEARLLALIESTGAEIIVLARYMQVLSEGLCDTLAGRVINIHHSFLPGFKGAKPYQQAFERGVKLIGATAHFATPDLDEGPIIEQAVERVDHAHTAEQLLSVGRHVESLVLARALQAVLERRVFVNGRRTVVLR